MTGVLAAQHPVAVQEWLAASLSAHPEVNVVAKAQGIVAFGTTAGTVRAPDMQRLSQALVPRGTT